MPQKAPIQQISPYQEKLKRHVTGKLMSDPYGGRLPKRFMVAS